MSSRGLYDVADSGSGAPRTLIWGECSGASDNNATQPNNESGAVVVQIWEARVGMTKSERLRKCVKVGIWWLRERVRVVEEDKRWRNRWLC